MITKKLIFFQKWQEAKKNGERFNVSGTCRDIGLDASTGFKYIKDFNNGFGKNETPPVVSKNDCLTCIDKIRMEKAIKELRSDLEYYKKHSVTTDEIKEYIIGVRDAKKEIPIWAQTEFSGPAEVIPMLTLSDIHASEIVEPSQVFNLNKYNLKICEESLMNVRDNVIELLTSHINAKYQGIYVNLNGDFVSGDIHDELTATNDKPVMPTVLELFGMIVRLLDDLATRYGHVVVNATAGGNHSRTTKKVPYKNKAFTNFDWLIYRFVQKHFESISDKRITFNISDADDIQFKVYNHIFRMTHGDGGPFGGGQGFIGAAAPVIRGDNKKRSSSVSYNMAYDTLILSHFHQEIFAPGVIVNSSVIGFNEMAIKNGYKYARPTQSLVLVHGENGVTGKYPVFCDYPRTRRV